MEEESRNRAEFPGDPDSLDKETEKVKGRGRGVKEEGERKEKQ